MVHLSRAIVDELVEHAREELPNECCGIIASRDGEAVELFRARNALASPVRYEVHPQDLLRLLKEIEANGWDLGAIYHSHTKSAPFPSQTDINLAEGWPDPVYLIVSLRDADEPELRGFRIVDREVDEVELSIAK
jgi:[CysO sulfur-carrier protein]-S-L-cysteine hydrolase